MAIAKAGLRKITVDGILYGWRVSRSDDWGFHVNVVPWETRKPVLTGFFLHHKYFGPLPQPPHPAISPGLVEKLIRLGKEKGWEPAADGKDFALRDCDALLNLSGTEAIARIQRLVDQLGHHLDDHGRKEVLHFNSYGEVKLAFETLCDFLADSRTSLTKNERTKLEQTGKALGVDEKYWSNGAAR